MTRSFAKYLALTLVVGCVHPGRQAALATPCAQPSPHALGAVEELKGVLGNNDAVLAEYRASLGFAGVEPQSVVAVTDPRTCGAVSAAVGSYLRRSGPMESLYVVKVGPRYVALDSRGAAAAQYVLTRKFEVTDYLAP